MAVQFSATELPAGAVAPTGQGTGPAPAPHTKLGAQGWSLLVAPPAQTIPALQFRHGCGASAVAARPMAAEKVPGRHGEQ